jgi:hypothetical protein
MPSNKSIDTLVDDIYGLFKSGKKFSEESIKIFGEKLATHISNRVSDNSPTPSLRMSNLGTPCKRRLWYSVKAPELGEPLTPQTYFKFLIGDILEELVLFLAKEAGHDVKDTQEEVELHGVKGHTDGTIDGVLVDIKSTSSFSFRKFKEGLRKVSDDFGYLVQLGGYRQARRKDKETPPGPAAFIAVDKTLGHICVDIHNEDLDINYEKLVADAKQILANPEPPPRHYDDAPEGKSGNRKIPMPCSYCQYKEPCWGNLRKFVYSNGPVWFTKVVREPNVPEER